MARGAHLLLLLVAVALLGCAPSARRTETRRAATEEPPAAELPAAPERTPAPTVTATPREGGSVDGWRVIDVRHPVAPGTRGPGAPFISGVWGRGPDDVYVVGDEGVVLHFDGRTWTAQPSEPTEHYTAVWGHSGRLFMAGMAEPERGIIRHQDGRSWRLHRTPGTPYLSAVWGSGADDVFAVGAQGAIFHYDGHRWSRQSSGTTQDLLGVWGSAGGDVFAVGHEGTIVHYDGRAWSPMGSGVSAHLRGVWGSSGGDVFVVGDELVLHYDGHAWTASSMERDFLHAVSGSGPTDVIAVGHNGVILRYDGQSWQRNPRTLRGSVRSPGGGTIHVLDTRFTADLTSVWAAGPSRFFAGGRGSILTFAGGP